MDGTPFLQIARSCREGKKRPRGVCEHCSPSQSVARIWSTDLPPFTTTVFFTSDTHTEIYDKTTPPAGRLTPLQRASRGNHGNAKVMGTTRAVDGIITTTTTTTTTNNNNNNSNSVVWECNLVREIVYVGTKQGSPVHGPFDSWVSFLHFLWVLRGRLKLAFRVKGWTSFQLRFR